MSVSLDDQIKCAKRELAMRERVYAQWVGQRRMSVAKSEHEIAAMRAIVESLTRLRDSTERLL